MRIHKEMHSGRTACQRQREMRTEQSPEHPDNTLTLPIAVHRHPIVVEESIAYGLTRWSMRQCGPVIRATPSLRLHGRRRPLTGECVRWSHAVELLARLIVQCFPYGNRCYAGFD